ncbi:MAG: glycogen/starch synthase [Candidatus Methanomethyliaceae archaeon]|nr:glycogen/starch synthase [Candidatus Methanomethyliaceae archaeon]MDW7970617.1 glycosyltransferase [Nitrososphaerota archaeon]
MKPILHITWEYPPFVVGALSNFLHKLIPKLAQKYPLILVIRGDFDEKYSSEGVTIYKVGPYARIAPHILSFAYMLSIDLTRGASNAIHDHGGVSLIHSHDWISSISALYLSHFFKSPLVISVYSTEVKRAGSISTLLNMGIFDLEKKCFEKADIIIVENYDMRMHLVRDYEINNNKIFLARNAEEIINVYRRMLQ